MRIYHSESFTTIEATAEEIRSSRSLSETITSALNNLVQQGCARRGSGRGRRAGRGGRRRMSLISREKAITVLTRLPGIGHKALNAIRELPEEQDAEAYQRGYEDGFREGRTRKELIDALDDDLK